MAGPNGQGWKVKNDELVVDWTSLDPAPTLFFSLSHVGVEQIARVTDVHALKLGCGALTFAVAIETNVKTLKHTQNGKMIVNSRIKKMSRLIN